MFRALGSLQFFSRFCKLTIWPHDLGAFVMRPTVSFSWPYFCLWAFYVCRQCLRFLNKGLDVLASLRFYHFLPFCVHHCCMVHLFMLIVLSRIGIWVHTFNFYNPDWNKDFIILFEVNRGKTTFVLNCQKGLYEGFAAGFFQLSLSVLFFFRDALHHLLTSVWLACTHLLVLSMCWLLKNVLCFWQELHTMPCKEAKGDKW